MSLSIKLKVVNATVMPVLMYGYKTCTLLGLSKQQQVKFKVQATQVINNVHMLCTIDGINRLDRINILHCMGRG